MDFACAELSEGIPAILQSGVGIESYIVECVEQELRGHIAAAAYARLKLACQEAPGVVGWREHSVKGRCLAGHFSSVPHIRSEYDEPFYIGGRQAADALPSAERDGGAALQ